ncbi:MAG: hypothetical protein JSV65_18415 [Armatimonadota bacterium]|nr:MAG: hypothetical protein JSV65_18415 [Armatimonadota bacterium]
MKRWVPLLVVLLAVVLLPGCGDDDDPDRRALLNSVNGLMTGWVQEDSRYLQLYISEDYAFDEQSKADHIAAIVEDFPYLRNLTFVRQHAQIVSPNIATVQVEFAADLLADIAALDYPTTIEAWVRTDNWFDQVWIKDFDGVWRLAAEYLQRSWVLDDTPVIDFFSVDPGDQIPPGDTGGFTASAYAGSTAHRVTLWPDSDAAAYFDPDYAFGFGSASYSGDITVRSDAYGEYSFAMIGQTDIPGSAQMLGRRLRAEYIVVSDRAGRAIIGGKTVPGNRQSIFRRMRILRAAGQREDPVPGATP